MLEKENDGHAYFIKVLRDTYEMLSSAGKDRIKTAKPIASGKKGKGKQAAARGHVLNNLFAHLYLEEPSAKPLGSGRTPSKPTASDTTPPTTKFRLKANEVDDVAFEIWCFLEDLNDVRMYIREAWREYVRGDVTLIAAGLTCNTGFGLMRQANEEFLKAHPDFRDYWYIHDFLKLRLKAEDAITIIMPAEGVTKKQQQPRADINPAALLCTSGAVAMCWLRDPLTSEYREVRVEDSPYAGSDLPANATVVESKAREGDKFPQYPCHQFVGSLLSSALEMQMFSRSKEERHAGYWSGDEFFYGILEYAKASAAYLPIWLAPQLHRPISRFMTCLVARCALLPIWCASAFVSGGRRSGFT